MGSVRGGGGREEIETPNLLNSCPECYPYLMIETNNYEEHNQQNRLLVVWTIIVSYMFKNILAEIC